MKSKLILITGGARSGKSDFAESLVKLYSEGREERAAYLATAQALDREMAARIERHKISRPQNWRTYEEAYWPDRAFGQALQEGRQVVLLDCLTMLTSNWLCRLTEPGREQPEEAVLMAGLLPPFQRLIERFRASQDAVLIAVTNEVGWGIVPGDPFTRAFRDAAGRINRLMAAEADQVWLVVAGQTLQIKPGR